MTASISSEPYFSPLPANECHLLTLGFEIKDAGSIVTASDKWCTCVCVSATLYRQRELKIEFSERRTRMCFSLNMFEWYGEVYVARAITTVFSFKYYCCNYITNDIKI